MSEAVSEMDNLPNGWILVKIDYICKLIGGGTPSRKNLDYFNGDIVWLTPTEISKNNIQKIYDSKEKITKLGLEKSSARVIPINSVLLTTRASIGYVAIAGTNTSTNQGFASFSCNGAVFNYYLAHWLWSKKNFLEFEATGTTFKEISKSKLREIQIPLPPLAEQKRIVSKIESILAQIDGARTRLEVASGMLNKLRSSVLRQAFEGKLVSQDPNDEPAEIILKRVHRDPMKKMVFEMNNLPNGWIKANLKYLVEKIQKIDPRKTSDKIYYYCDINSIDNSKLKITNPKQIIGRNAPSRARQLIKKNDILFSTVRTYLKNIAIVPDNFHEQLASTGFCVIRSTINHKFVFYYIQSKSFLDVINKIQRGTSYPAVRNNDVLSILVPVSPLNEQRRIVGKIESIFTRIDAIERYIESTLQLLDLLKSSTLKQAFEGRLVPQDPDDEPAEFLLQIVKQEKQLIKSQKSSYGRKNVR